ncbi:CLUMA_CG000323, isoform A [Clunio marinus]|uniref:CLUMA_CG000323, isoform A n=1 Tax=Clunio marinus TaxID=568069 RepID=A0A1J1HIW5_9DIPT|nr:CLUMA_CG000323, isoform A [Clunio marinus]
MEPEMLHHKSINSKVLSALRFVMASTAHKESARIMQNLLKLRSEGTKNLESRIWMWLKIREW